MSPDLGAARRELAGKLAGERGYCGVGVSEDAQGNAVLVVFVEDAGSPARRAAPATCGGVPVRVEITGKARKQDQSGDPNTSR